MNIDTNSNIALDDSLPEPTRSQVMLARMRALYGQINLSKQEVEMLILVTPSGDERNNLSNVHIQIMIAMNILAAVANKKETEPIK